MASVTSEIIGETNFPELKSIAPEKVRAEAVSLLIQGENILQAFQTVRDQVVFTNKRVLVVNVQGVTGTRISYFSYPYSKVQYFGIQTAGILDLDSELVLIFNDGMTLQFDFRTKVDIRGICAAISGFIL